MEKIALVDFCGTIVNFQTIDAFLEFVISKRSRTCYRILCNRVVAKTLQLTGGMLFRVGIRFQCYKILLIRQLRGLPHEQLSQLGKAFYEEMIRPNLIPTTIELIRTLQRSGERVIILSAALPEYVECFAREYGIRDIVTARLDLKDSVCTGKLAVECMGEDKIRQLRQYIQEHGISGEFSVGITDHWTDFPMLEMCKRRVVISRREHQRWVSDDMEELIWN